MEARDDDLVYAMSFIDNLEMNKGYTPTIDLDRMAPLAAGFAGSLVSET